MPIVSGLDIHRKQITFDYLDTETGEVKRGQIAPADCPHLRAWLARFAGRNDVAFALEGCTGWRYVAEELAVAGVAAHVAEPADAAFARGRKRHATTDKTDCRHLRELLAEGRLPECWIPPSLILEYRALLETYHDLRAEHTAWIQRIHAALFHQGAPAPGEAALRTGRDLQALRVAAACHLSPAGQLQVDTALGMLAALEARLDVLMDLGQRAAVKFLIRDRASQFTGSFDAVFTAEGIRILASPPRAPRENAICERVIGTLRRELFDRLLIVNEHHLRQVLTEYLQHYNTGRPHRALGQLAPAQADSRPPEINLAEHRIRRRQVLGGLTHEYQVAA